MIEIYVGAVGSGKSYHAMARGISKIYAMKNNIVVANFPVKFTDKDYKKGVNNRWIYLDDEELTPINLIKMSFKHGFYGKEGHTLLIIDEAGVYFNARDWQISAQTRKEWIKFFSQSRKFGYDVVLIAQDVRIIDRQIRTTAEYIVKHVKLRNYKWLKLIPWQIFAAVNYWAGGSFKGNVNLILFNPFIAKRYDTMRMFKVPDELKDIACVSEVSSMS